MSDQLKEQLEQLRSELESATGLSGERRERLLTLISGIEESGQEDAHGLRQQTDALIAEFDVSHPTLAAVIKRVMETLANIGV